MKLLVLGLIAGCAIGYGANALAVHATTTAANECHASYGKTRICELRTDREYQVTARALDLSCIVLLPRKAYGTGYAMSCQRTSRAGDCVNGIAGSLTALIEPFKMYFKLPD